MGGLTIKYPNAMTKGIDFIKKARKHIGERYVYGAPVPKDNARWQGPWDCAEFISWVAFQVTGKLYGCNNNNQVAPASADAYTGYWANDARNQVVEKVSIAAALRRPGAILLRVPSSSDGHIVFSDGKGGTVEAHSTNRGVIAGDARDRRWDMGLLLPDVEYTENPPVARMALAEILRLKKPYMKGEAVKEVQRALKAHEISPGKIDGVYGPQTAAAVTAFQLEQGLNPDGEVGPITMQALGL